jgi:hypothetical protein
MYRTDGLIAPQAPRDVRRARQELRTRIVALERQLAEALTAELPRLPGDRVALSSAWSGSTGARGRSPAPRLTTLAELHDEHDALVVRLRDARALLRERRGREADRRLLLDDLHRAPAQHRFVRLTEGDLGGRDCRTYAVRPRMGPLGILLGWWRVKVSSGCPLRRPRLVPTRRGPTPRERRPSRPATRLAAQSGRRPAKLRRVAAAFRFSGGP